MVWILSIRNASATLCWILVSVLLSSLEEILMFVSYVRNFNNLVIGNYASLPILFSIYLAYYLHEDFTPPVRRVIGITGLTGFIFMIIQLVLYPADQFLNVLHGIMYGALVLLSLYYFIHKVFFTTQFEIGKHPMFWISCALFVHSFTVITVLSTYSLLPEHIHETLWMIKKIAYIFYNAAIAYGFYIFSKYRLSL